MADPTVGGIPRDVDVGSVGGALRACLGKHGIEFKRGEVSAKCWALHQVDAICHVAYKWWERYWMMLSC